MGVFFTAYSDVVDPVTTAKVSAFERRTVVSDNSCTTCHNDATAFHKNGAFNEGGKACIACHDNGMERTSATLGAGFGPMVHSWHWGEGAKVGEVKADEPLTEQAQLKRQQAVLLVTKQRLNLRKYLTSTFLNPVVK
ncbi:hypothetical protein DIKCMJMK_00327 [Shewanella oneidensis]|nr:hypothetical protein [Shewanella oneidensis]